MLRSDPMLRRDPMLRCERLTKRYGEVTALDALELEVAPGEVVSLLGPNGAGKSTTLSLLLGFIRPSSGAAYVAGSRVDHDPEEARRHIAYVPEQFRLYPDLTGAENLAYFAGLAGVPSLADGLLVELLVQSGLAEGAAHQRAGGYSKGMRQKVVLALARARRASALLLDEPTTGLDPNAVEDLCMLVERERERGAAVLMVTHDLGAVTAVSQRIGVLRGGRLVELISARGLREADVLQLYRTHFAAPPARPTVGGSPP